MDNCQYCRYCCRRIITVHEIGFMEIGYLTPDRMNYVMCPRHFIRFAEPRKRELMLSAIKEIGNFDLPIYNFHRRSKRKWIIFNYDEWTWKKTDSARGCVITMLDGSTVFTKEMEYEVKSMIENCK